MTSHDPVKKQHVWVLSDGIAGHFNQSKGVLLALGLDAQLEVEWLELELRFGFLRRVLRYGLNASRGQMRLALLRWCYPALDLPDQMPDIIVAAGGRMMYAAAALRSLTQAKTIFVGSLRGLDPALFDAVLVLEQHPEPQYLTVELAPMPVDHRVLMQAAQTWQVQHPQVSGTLWTMLIGGDGAGANYTEQDWLALAQHMNTLAKRHHIRWLVTTSRRTGAAAERVLKQTLHTESLADQVWWSESPRKVMAAFLARASVVCCTAESMSMITEAIIALRPVIALRPAQFAPDDRYQAALTRLVSKQRIMLAPITEILDATTRINQLSTLEHDPCQMLAHQLKDYLSA